MCCSSQMCGLDPKGNLPPRCASCGWVMNCYELRDLPKDVADQFDAFPLTAANLIAIERMTARKETES